MNIAHVVTSEMGSPEFNVKTVRMNIFWPFHAVVAGSGVSHSSLTCPSCHAKKGILFGDLLKNNILYPVPHRQYVFTIPIMLRVYFKFNRKLLTKLAHCAQRSLIEFFRISIGVPSGVPGLVTAIQTFGNYPEKFHPHLHIISTDGLFKKNGLSYVMPRRSLRPLKRLFQAEVFKMLKKEGLLRDEQINILLK